MFLYVVSRRNAEIFSLLRICSGLLSNTPGLQYFYTCDFYCKQIKSGLYIALEFNLMFFLFCFLEPHTRFLYPYKVY